MLSIVYVWDADYPWDVRTEKICAALSAAGHHVTIVARNRGWLPELERRPEAAIHRMRPWKSLGRTIDGLLGFPAFFSPRWLALIRDAISASEADVVIVRDLPLCPTVIAVCRRFHVPVILDMAENYPAMMRDRRRSQRSIVVDALVRNPRVTDWVERYCITRVDHILTVVDESSARLGGLGIASHKMTVVSNTPPLVRALRPRRPKAITQHEFTAVYLGLLEVARGVAELVDAIRIVRDRNGPRVRATIIGGGRDAESFAAQARAAGLVDADIEFRGFLPHAEALEIVSKADIGIIPHHATESWNSTIPNKLFDYMSAGLPVVSSDTGPCSRIIRTVGCGEVFESGNAQSLADAIVRVADAETAHAMGEAGRLAVVDRFHWERDVQALLAAVGTVVRDI